MDTTSLGGVTNVAVACSSEIYHPPRQQQIFPVFYAGLPPMVGVDDVDCESYENGKVNSKDDSRLRTNLDSIDVPENSRKGNVTAVGLRFVMKVQRILLVKFLLLKIL